jgi:SEC-C motif domain protein
MDKFAKCPCDSKLLYLKCCKQYHEGNSPPTALALMRSRYSAYDLNLADYIIDTTHPEHSEFTTDRTRWREDIETFSKHTRFERLKILEFTDGEEEATVAFTAYMKQADQDASFSETSSFAKVNGKWLYKSGEVTTPRSTE